MPLSRARARLVHRLRDRKGRPREGRVLVEGPRAVETALNAGAHFDFAIVTVPDEPNDSESGWVRALETAGIELVRLPVGELEALSDTESPQGILAVVREPGSELPSGAPPKRALVLDRIQDPGNAGALIRSAAALGVDLVIALDGTVDPWNPKAVRASAGEAFRIPIVRATWAEMEAWRDPDRMPLLVADGSGRDVRSIRPSHPPASTSGSREATRESDPGRGKPTRWALLIGNEGAGPREEALTAAAAVIALPMSRGVESLNAAMAGSILLWTLGPGSEPAADDDSVSPSPPRSTTQRV